MHAHLLGNLKDLGVKLLKVNVIQVDLFVIFILLLMPGVVIQVIIFIHLG
jgi:hypothetical protein